MGYYLAMRRVIAWMAPLLLAQGLRAQPAPKQADLDKLFADAHAQHSNAVFVYQNEQPVRTEFFKAKDQRIYLYSVTKVFAGLAIGIAYDKGLIPSIDEPVSTWFPEMANDPLKSKIKLRHLLQHSSGILTTQGSQDIYPQHDFVKFALESPVVSTPGEEEKYNNRAVNIESGIIRTVTGKSMEEWLVENLFKPLGITDYKFRHDDAGNTWAMDGLELKASDIVKIACVLADDGKWQGNQIVSERWLAVAEQASLISMGTDANPYGLGLFVFDPPDARLTIPIATVDALEKAGLSPDLVVKLRTVEGREFKGGIKFGQAMKQQFSATELEEISAMAGRKMIPVYRNLNGRVIVGHEGEIGEYIVALPAYHIAVARTIDEKRGRAGDYQLHTLFQRVYDLAPAAGHQP
jgi:CubicO group peptidase (beta-lactamase class C family)